MLTKHPYQDQQVENHANGMDQPESEHLENVENMHYDMRAVRYDDKMEENE